MPSIKKDQLDWVNELQAYLERDLELLKNEKETLGLHEKERSGVHKSREAAAPQVSAAVCSSVELGKLERGNTVL